MTSRPSAPTSLACFASSVVSMMFGVPGPTMTLRPFRCFITVSVTIRRSLVEKDGNSPEVPSTTTPSAPHFLCQAMISAMATGSKSPFLLHGVMVATQYSVLALLPSRGAASAPEALPIIPAAASPPSNPNVSLRVVSIVRTPQVSPVSPAMIPFRRSRFTDRYQVHRSRIPAPAFRTDDARNWHKAKESSSPGADAAKFEGGRPSAARPAHRVVHSRLMRSDPNHSCDADLHGVPPN